MVIFWSPSFLLDRGADPNIGGLVYIDALVSVVEVMASRCELIKKTVRVQCRCEAYHSEDGYSLSTSGRFGIFLIYRCWIEHPEEVLKDDTRIEGYKEFIASG